MLVFFPHNQADPIVGYFDLEFNLISCSLKENKLLQIQFIL